MNSPINQADQTALTAIVTSLESAWNQGDGNAFAVPFLDDADFVNVRAEHLQGRGAIAAGHVGILKSIYAGSVNKYAVRSMRMLGNDVALVHVQANLDVPAGPLAGKQCAVFSMVLVRTPSGWMITSFHNTMEPPKHA